MAITLSATLPSGTDVQEVGANASGGMRFGASTSELIAFYGTTAISQRAAAAQATSAVGTASSTAIDTATKAAIIEIMNTLTNLGLWKGSA